jgi:hypothetical protein
MSGIQVFVYHVQAKEIKGRYHEVILYEKLCKISWANIQVSVYHVQVREITGQISGGNSL